MNYYNEIDPFSSKWLEALIENKMIPAGKVDTRSIVEVQPNDLSGFTQCHFFSGLGGWSKALELAMCSNQPFWTGSCPCQPFSAAGKRKGEKDARHLWPEFKRLISACKPPVVFGEQVASSEVVGTQLEASFLVAVQNGDYARANKLAKRLVASKSFHYWARWIDGVQADMATEGYSFGFKVLGAHSVGSPNIRQRLWWMAYSSFSANQRSKPQQGKRPISKSDGGSVTDNRLADPQNNNRRPRIVGEEEGTWPDGEWRRGPSGGCDDGGLGKPESIRLQKPGEESGCPPKPSGSNGSGLADAISINDDRTGHGAGNDSREREGAERLPGFWDNYRFVQCRDGKQRRIPQPAFQLMVDGLPASLGADWLSDCFEDEAEVQGFYESYHEILKDMSTLFPLCGKVPGRVGVLRGAGNAINPYVGAEFIKAFAGYLGGQR